MLAIVIPYYKLTFFEETLRSLVNQTDKRFKVYIGDDASPENPAVLLEKYQGKFNFSYKRFESNIGGTSLTKQWNRCIAMTSYEEWLMILGDDDVLQKNVVEEFYNHYNIFNEKSNVIRFATQLIFEESNTISDIFVHPVWESATHSFYRKFLNLTRSSLSEYIFKKSSYIKYGFYDYPLAWNSDDHAWLEFSDEKPIYSLNDSVVFVRISNLNISGKQDNTTLKGLSEIKFYKFMVLTNLKFYNEQQRDSLMRRYESEIKKTRNFRSSEWFLLLFFYLKYFESNRLKKFIKRFLKNLVKIHDS